MNSEVLMRKRCPAQIALVLTIFITSGMVVAIAIIGAKMSFEFSDHTRIENQPARRRLQGETR